ncbi:MAG: DUF86 domain-containing protein [Chitinophagaceae bacterium]
MSERALPLLLDDIADAICNILDYTKGMAQHVYEQDLKTRQAVERNFEIMGEATSRIPSIFKNQHPSINWRQLKDFRNFIIHDYFGIDNNIVWQVISITLPDFLEQIKDLRNQLK